MEIKKVSDSYNMYTMKVSFGELEELKNKLASDHSGPIADSMYEAITWYIENNLPGPGEDKSKKDVEKEEAKTEKAAEDEIDLDEPPVLGDEGVAGSEDRTGPSGPVNDEPESDDSVGSIPSSDEELDQELPEPPKI